MNDDEAFVRSIVRSPDDETARLVYADWLEERDDPRGLFLRAEAAAFRSVRPRAKRSSLSRLRAAEKSLDAVWVARISRPPVGVCVAHLSAFRGVSEFDTAAEVEALVAWLGVRVPPVYHAFLLNYNHLFRDSRVAHGRLDTRNRHLGYVGSGPGSPDDLWFLPTTQADLGSDAPSDHHTSVLRDRDEDYDLNPVTTGGTRLNAVIRIGCLGDVERFVVLCVGHRHTGEIRCMFPGSCGAKELAESLPALLGETLDAEPFYDP